MNEFLNKYYQESIELDERFKVTKKNPWNSLIVMNELNVQMGHILSITSNSSHKEVYRNINNIGDEISDVFFQLILLVYYSNYDITKVTYNSQDDSLESFIIVLGQATEAIMEKNGYRFEKPREGFDTIDQYILHKISNMFSILYNYSKKVCEIEKEYRQMLIDANNFINKYNKS